MTRKEAIEWVENQDAKYFSFGYEDLDILVLKEDTLADFESLSDDQFGSCEVGKSIIAHDDKEPVGAILRRLGWDYFENLQGEGWEVDQLFADGARMLEQGGSYNADHGYIVCLDGDEYRKVK